MATCLLPVVGHARAHARPLLLWLAVCLVAAFATACGSAQPGPGECHRGWIRTEGGGCAPAIVACFDDRSAAQDACAPFLEPPRARDANATGDSGDSGDAAVTTADANADAVADTPSVMLSWRRWPDGAVQGGWPVPDFRPVVPDEMFAPDAGITACPPNWRLDPAGGCDPVVDRTSCAADTAALPGGACTRTGAMFCPPTGPWADVEAERGSAPVIYVLAAADPMLADGTRAHPYRTIGRALTTAAAGSWVLVGDGTYNEPDLQFTSAVHLVGSCTARVRIRGEDASAVLTARSVRGAEVRNVSLEHGYVALSVSGDSQVRVRSVRAANVARAGIECLGASTTCDLEDVWVSNVSRPMGQPAAAGFVSATGAVVRARRCVADHVTGHGVVASSGSFDFDDSAVRDLQNDPGFSVPAGVGALEAGTLRVHRAVVESVVGVGIIVQSATSDVTVDDSVVRAIREFNPSVSSVCAARASGGRLALTQVTIADVPVGVRVYTATSVVSADRVVVRDAPRPTVDGEGSAFRVYGGSLVVRGSLMLRATGTAFVALSADARATLEHSVIDGVIRNELQPGTFALVATGGASIRATSIAVRDTPVGLAAQFAGSSLTVDDSVVALGREDEPNRIRIAVQASSGGAIRLTRTLVSGAFTSGLLASGADSRVDADGLAVRVLGARLLGRGFGAVAQDQGVVDVRHARIDGACNAGGLATTNGTLRAIDSVVEGTVRPPSTPTAIGVAAYRLGTVDLVRTAIRNSEVSGLAAQTNSTLRVDDVAVVDVRPTRYTPQTAFDELGIGVLIDDHTQAWVRGLYVRDVSEFGVRISRRATVDAEDVWVDGVRRLEPGFGVGVYAAGGATGTFRGLVVTDVFGAGVVSTRGAVDGVIDDDPATVTIEDAYVHRVRSSVIAWLGGFLEPSRPAAPVAYGLHAADRCALHATRATVDAAGYGFFNAGVMFRLAGATFTRCADAAGASAFATSSGETFDDVHMVNNAVNAILREQRLPQAASLPAPTEICVGPACGG